MFPDTRHLVLGIPKLLLSASISFDRLAILTRRDRTPELRIAHCLRDIAFGNKSRIDDFRSMLTSSDPELRRVFVDAFWIDEDLERPGRKNRK